MTKTVQFQQSIYSSTAKRAAGLQVVIEGMQDVLDDGEDAWNDADYNTHKSQVGGHLSLSLARQNTRPPNRPVGLCWNRS